ncbi:hypothetical protein GHR37_29330 [Achromobacter xylosoxidans]|nr:hypothetical protein [Achromobacter xylosoxidans]
MTPPNFTPQGADVALDPMAGTLTPDSFARAADPWARDGAQTSTISPESRASACGTVAPSVGLNVTILALDLGTKTGYALRRRDGSTRHGTEVFTPRKSWSEGQKWARYRAWLAGVIHDEQVHRVVYEQVIRHESKGRPLWDAAHAYGAFEAITHMVCDGFNIQAHGVNLATVKKSFTGSGRAKKEDMMLQAKARGFKVVDDNNADALGILHWAVAQERAA